MQARWQEVKVEDRPMPLFVARPTAGTPTRAVVILQEIFGVNDHIQDVTKRVAELGYLAVAPDLFYRQGSRLNFKYDELEKAMPHAKAMTNESYLKDIDQVFAFLKTNYKIESTETVFAGFCLGGRFTYLTATKREIAGGISFYGGGIPSGPIEGTPQITCPMLLFFGGLDQHIPASDVEKVRLALHENDIESEVITYEKAGHGFFCGEKPAYSPEAAGDAWMRVQAFLKSSLV